jgi:hypothetical protein
VEALRSALAMRGDTLTCLWGEGDSTDGTLARLTELTRLFDARVIDVTHGGPAFGPVVNMQRFRQLAYVANTIWEQLPADMDAMVWVESDLIWEAETLLRLIDRLATYPAVAPMVLDSLPATGAQANHTFYDTLVFRRNGVRFAKPLPYHADVPAANGGMLRVDSAGSVLAMRAEVARGVYVPIEDVLIGTCRMIYEQGGSVWVDTGLTVWHQ